MSKSRLESVFSALKQKSKGALIPFITAGDPQPDYTVPLMHAMVDAGADVIELGVPFSDPMAEGPVIQAACERALRHHIGLNHVFSMVREFRQTDTETPVVLMGYLNPVEVMGYDEFARQAVASGVDGVLTVDMPPDESHDYKRAMQTAGLDTIFLVAPTSTEERIKNICQHSSGFVYYVSLKGVTGAMHLDSESVAEKVRQIKVHTDLPVGVGFGIKDAETAGKIASVADAVVVGSAIVNRVAEFADRPTEMRTQVAELLTSMRQAIDANSRLEFKVAD